MIHQRRGFLVVSTADVEWISGARNHVLLHVGGEAIPYRHRLGALAAELGRPFLRIHRSIIVNVDRIAELDRGAAGYYVLTLSGGARLKVARRYSRAVLTALGGVYRRRR